MIDTERLILRAFAPEDLDAYVEIMSSPAVYRYLGNGQGQTRDQIEHWMNQWNGTFGHGMGVYAVVERESGKLIGHCGLRGLICGRKEILYAIAESAWGKGYATEAMRAVLDAHDFRPLMAVSYPENTASMGVMKKLGFKHIGQEVMFGTTLESYILE